MHFYARFSAFLLPVLSSNALAQVDPAITGCPNIQSAPVKAQAESCAAHPACSLVLKAQKTCSASGDYLVRLQEATRRLQPSNLATPSLEAIFEAAITPQFAQIEEFEQAREFIKQIRALPMGRQQLVKKDIAGNPVLYYGDVRNGMAHGNGYQINEYSISRGGFSEDEMHGLNEIIIFSNFGRRLIGERKNGVLHGRYAEVTSTLDEYSVGKQLEAGRTMVARGRVKNGLLEGVWVDGKFVFGNKYLNNGARTEIWGRPDPKVSTLDLAKSWSSAKFDAGKIPLEISDQPTAVLESKSKADSQVASGGVDFTAVSSTVNAPPAAAPSPSCRTRYTLPFAGKRYAHPTLAPWGEQAVAFDLRKAVRDAQAGGYPKEVAYRLSIAQAERFEQAIQKSIESAAAVSTTSGDIRAQIMAGLPLDYQCNMAAAAAVCAAQTYYWQALIARQTAEGITCLW